MSLVLSEQLGDLRSRGVLYNVTVENLGERSLYIRSISPRVGEQVAVRQVRTPADLEGSDEVEHLCAEIERLLITWLTSVSRHDPLRSRGRLEQRWLGYVRDRFVANLVDVLLLPVTLALRLARELAAAVGLPRLVASPEGEAEHRVAQLVPRLQSYAAAADAVRDLTREHEGDVPPLLAAALATRLSQLERLAADPTDGGDAYLAFLPPDSQYAQTLELDFARGLLNARKYTVSIEVKYVEVDDGATPPPRTAPARVRTAVESLVISPNPVLVTLTAVVGAVLGTVLRFAAAEAPDDPVDLSAPLEQLTSGAGVTAVILALVFFNGFEFTSLAGRFTRHVNWRGALLIGVVCGLSSERILRALQAVLAG